MLHYSYCSHCGANDPVFDPIETSFTCSKCHCTQYLNSKPSVCAVVLRGNSVLLVSPWDRPLSWDLPGGFLRFGEDPADGLVRELREELSAQVYVKGLLTAKVDTYGNDELSLNLFFAVDLATEHIIPSNEIANHGWYPLDGLPLLTYDSAREVLRLVSTGGLPGLQ